MANPVYGDMLYELHYTEYKDFARREIPYRPTHSSGDPLRGIAHKFMGIKVTSVQSKVTVPAIRVLGAVRSVPARLTSSVAKAGRPPGSPLPPLAQLS